MVAVVVAAWAWALAQWPQVYPNLIASGICTGALWIKMHLANRRLHAANERLHDRLDALHHHLTREQRAKEQP